MTTPLDPALRLQRRALDTLRLSLAAEAAVEAALAAEAQALARTAADEAALAAGDWRLSAHPYARRLQARRADVAAAGEASTARLSGLRRAALDACGQLVAMTGVADALRAEQDRMAAGREQAAADDRAAGRWMAALSRP